MKNFPKHKLVRFAAFSKAVMGKHCGDEVRNYQAGAKIGSQQGSDADVLERRRSPALSPILQMAERVPRAVLARKYSDMVKQVRPGAEIKVDFVE